jgi:hypothetical protein
MDLTLQKRLTRASFILAIIVALLSQQSTSFVYNLHSNSLKLTSFFSASGSINHPSTSSTRLRLSEEENANPLTFREAEILGLKLMQNGNYQGAIKGEFDMSRKRRFLLFW